MCHLNLVLCVCVGGGEGEEGVTTLAGVVGRCVICVWYIGRNVDRLKLLNSTPAAIFIFYLVCVSPEFGSYVELGV